MRRGAGRVVLALVFAVLGGGAWVQAFVTFFNNEPRALVAFHLCLAITGSAAAIGSWTMARWAPIAALLYGATTVGLLLTLTSILQLDPSAGSGLRIGAAVVLAFSVWAAWYLQRLSKARAASENRAG